MQEGLGDGVRGVGSYVVDVLPKAEVEIVCKDSYTDKIVDIIISASGTGPKGDGKIFAVPFGQHPGSTLGSGTRLGSEPGPFEDGNAPIFWARLPAGSANIVLS